MPSVDRDGSAPDRDAGGVLIAGPTPHPHASQRRRTWWRKLLARLAGPVFVGIQRSLWSTYRIQPILGAEHMQLLHSPQPIIVCYWHYRALSAGFWVQWLAERSVKFNYLVSPSVDGDIGASILEFGGATVTRGSATRTGVQSLRQMYRAMVRDGLSPAIAPDGPRGPILECKPGVVMLAQLAGARILPLTCAASSYIDLKSWDGSVVPRPFSRVVLAFGEPVSVPAEFGNDDLERAAKNLGDRLDELDARAAASLVRGTQPQRNR